MSALEKPRPSSSAAARGAGTIAVDLLEPGVQFADRDSVLGGFGIAESGFEAPQFGVAVQRVVDRGSRERGRLLGDVGDRPARRDLKVAGVGVEQAAQRGEQRRFSGSVRADQAYPPAGVKLKAGAVDQTLGAAGEHEIAQENHRKRGRRRNPVL